VASLVVFYIIQQLTSAHTLSRMYSLDPSNDARDQTLADFACRLPPLPNFSPLNLVIPHASELFQWHERYPEPEHSRTDTIPTTYVQGGSPSDPVSIFASTTLACLLLKRGYTGTGDRGIRQPACRFR
jgi:hypothetical protein